MKSLDGGDMLAKRASLLEELRAFDRARQSLPGEHWAAFGLGLYLLLRRSGSPVGRVASMVAGAALVARALSGRDGAIAMYRRAERRDAEDDLDGAAMPWPYDERVFVARIESEQTTEVDMSQKDHRIDVAREDEVREWAKKFDASPQQIKDAVQAVGDRADDVEMHLKGSRSTETADRVIERLGKNERSGGR